MHKPQMLRWLVSLLLPISLPALAAAPDLLYTLQSSTTIDSTDTGWDYIRLEPNGSRLFMARDKDGLTVFDVSKNRVVATIEDSVGANGPLLLPQFDRGYVAMTDGSLLSFEMRSLKKIERKQFATDGGLNSAVYDPLTRRVHAIVSSRPAESTWYSLDAASGKLLAKTVFPFRKMDDPAVDPRGFLFTPIRFDEFILKLDSKTLKERARWPVGCWVSKIHYQASTNRILAACTGDKPAFVALDADSGKLLARIPIGRGIDGFFVDEKRHRIVTTNGADGTMSVIGQLSADVYELLGTVSMRVGARMMEGDPESGLLYVVTADSTAGQPDEKGVAPRRYHPNSFTVMRYEPR